MKKLIGTSMCLVLVILVVARIWYVNRDIDEQITETYSIGDEVTIGNNIFYEDYEDMSDYTVTVKGAEILTYEEFLDKYNYKEKESESLFEEGDMTFPEMVYDVDIVIRNVNKEENELGGINLFNYMLVTSDTLLQMSAPLYEISNPTLEDGTMQFKLRPDTEMEFHLPFYFQPSTNYLPISVEKIRNADLRLVVSLYPVQQEIQIVDGKL